MNIPTDQQFLADYAQSRSEAAFTELVRRHIDLVHSAAWRLTGESHSAQDVTQAVFVTLAQNAAQLTGHPVISGWLHTTARNLAAKHVRAAVRRQAREQEAVAMTESLSTPDASWQEIAPYLDAALGELSEADRDAVLLRYFEKKSTADMAQILGITDDAAQKRVTRAVEKLREFFSKRKITIGAGSLGILISANAVQSAPLAMTAIVSTAALTGTIVTTSAIIAATKTIAMTTFQKTVITVTVAVLAGAGIYEAKQMHDARADLQTLRQQQAPLADQIQQLQNEFAGATNRLAGLLTENSRLKADSNQSELLKLRGENTRLKNVIAENGEAQTKDDPIEIAARNWLAKVNLLKQRLEQNPSAKIPELQFATEMDWLNAALGTPELKTDDDYRWDLHNLLGMVEDKFGKMGNKALQKYLAANNGQFPSDLSQLQPYFESPVDDAILQRYEIVPASSIPKANEIGNDWLVAQKAHVLDNYKDESREVFGANGYGSTWAFW